MKVGMRIDGRSLGAVAEASRTAEDLGYDFITSNETAHNPFLPLVLAAEHTDRVDLVTSIALAFARSPMDIAYIAWDLQEQSGGRLVLGLGSQVRGHIVRRFGMNWSPPARRMREYILALRTIWDCFQNGTKLEIKGDSYNMNLMPPLFNPGPIQHPDIRVQIAAVNPWDAKGRWRGVRWGIAAHAQFREIHRGGHPSESSPGCVEVGPYPRGP